MKALWLFAATGCGPAASRTRGIFPPDTGDTAEAGPTESVPSADDVDPSAVLFSDEELPTFTIDLPQASWDALMADPGTYVEGAITWEGQTWSPVGVRTKGENSWLPLDRKPSLKVKIDWANPDLRMLGLRELTLNAMNDDASMMHERLAYRLYREAGVPAARATHASVVINDEPYGLYTHLDTVDRVMMQRWFEDDAGPLFEQHDVDFFDAYVPYFELEFGEDDRVTLQGVADAMEQAEPDARIAAAGQSLDYDSFLLYWAVGAYIAQFDGYPYSSPGDDCHVFVDAARGVLVYVPHGVDESFYYPEYDVEIYAGGVLSTACRQSEDCVARWRAMVWEVVAMTERIDLLGYFDEVQEQIAPLVQADTHQEHGGASIRYYQKAMRSFIENRAGQLEAWIGPRG